jgi:hypothetical protein
MNVPCWRSKAKTRLREYYAHIADRKNQIKEGTDIELSYEQHIARATSFQLLIEKRQALGVAVADDT